MKYDNLNQFKDNFSSYTELRVQENRNNRVNMINGDVTGNVAATTSGVSARVFKDGNWGFSSSPDITNDSIANVMEASTDNVQFMNKKDTTRCGIFLPETQANYEMNFATKKDRQNQKFWLDFVKEVDGYIEKKYPARPKPGSVKVVLDISFLYSHPLPLQNPTKISGSDDLFL
jgi:TldD protein